MNETKKHPLDEALEYSINGLYEISETILRNQPQDDFRVLFNLGWHEMLNGNLKKGFEYLNYGRYLNVFGSPPVSGKLWKDEPLQNKTLLLRSEGGYGDQILNFRFAKKFEEMGARVVISCSTELKELFSNHGFVCIDHDGIPFIHYDYWVPAMSAAYVLGMEYSDIDGSRYIYPKNPKHLFSKNKNFKVGIRWSGNPEFEHEQHRRFSPELMIGLSDIPTISLYSLQRDENCIDGLPFADMREQMKTWDDTANIIAGLDLVITSCTSIAHLAGAMGIPTWIVVPIMSYYTWVFPGEKSYWYNSVRLFRQEKYGEWDAPFTKIREELIKLSEEHTKHSI
jgi:hypothetical protein